MQIFILKVVRSGESGIHVDIPIISIKNKHYVSQILFHLFVVIYGFILN